MKFLHTGDLHIGKRLFEASVLEDQAHILEQIYEIALEERVQAVVLAGDLYDRSVPPAEAVTLLDNFLTRLIQADIPVIAVSGNHDSPERISFGEKILERQGLHMAGIYENSLRRVEITDGETRVRFLCLPFVRPAQVEETTSAAAVARILGREGMLPDREGQGSCCGREADQEPGSCREPERESSGEGEADQEPGSGREPEGESGSEGEADREPGSGREPEGEPGGEGVADQETPEEIPLRQVLVTHYFVTGENGQIPQLADSETGVNVGGIDNVPSDLFRTFDYVALGHIHRCQQVGAGSVWYAGAPMKYSFSEARGAKSVNIVELRGRNPAAVTRRFLTPLHEMRCIKGKLKDLVSPQAVGAEGVSSQDYIQATLTDREELIDPIGTLRSVYPNVMQILCQRYGETEGEKYESRIQGRPSSPQELFGEFYEMLTGEKLSEGQQALVQDVVESL